MSTIEPVLIYYSNHSMGRTVASDFADTAVLIMDECINMESTARRFGKNFPIDLWLDPTPEL